MDGETKRILEEQQLLSEVTNHQGWPIARRKLIEYLDELKNIEDLEDATPTTMWRDVRARKYARKILMLWLQEIEGSPEIVQNNTMKKTHIVNLED